MTTSPESTVNADPTTLEELIAELVRHESANPPGNERACAEYIHEWFDHHGIDSTLVTEPDETRPQVGARVGEGSPALVLNGHVDVVPAGDADAWTHDPYEPVLEDGRLYGRGSVDMKAGLALAMLTALEFAPAFDAGELEGSIVVHAAMGEETGDPGTKTLLESGFDGDYGIVLEPTLFRVATSAKGLGWYELTLPGEPAHASQPERGHNPIDDLRTVLERIEAYDEELREREDDLVGQAYATVTEVVAGGDSNKAVFPEEALVTLDRRVLPGETLEDVDAEVDALVEDVREAGVDLEWRRTSTYEAASIPVDSPLAETVREHTAAVTDASTEPWGIRASTDVRNFVNDAGVEAITWGPGNLEQAHTIDEYVDLADVEAGREILERVVRELLAGE